MASRSPSSSDVAPRPPAKPGAASPPQSRVAYDRRRPELTALHQAVAEGWPQLRELVHEQVQAPLPRFVQRGFEAYLACGQLAAGLTRCRCRDCGSEFVVAWSCKIRGLCASCDGKRMIEQTTHLLDSVLPEVPIRQFVLTFPFDVRLLLAWNAPMRSKVIAAFHRAVDRFYTARARLAGVPGPTKCAAVCVAQRFSSDLRLNLHIHTLFADGVWSQSDGQAVFHPSPPLGELDVQELLLDAQLRIDRQLQSGGWQDRNDDPFADDQPALAALMRAALRGRTVSLDTEQDAKRKAALRRLPRPNGANCAQADGYSLHANTRVGAFARDDLRRLVKYVCRPAISAQRVTRTDDGRYRVELKTPYRDGTHAVTLSAVDLTARLGALMQLPRCPAVRYYGCFAPNARARPQVVKAGAQAPCRRNKPRDLDLAELTELARNVPEGAQERIERYVAQEVERRTSTRLSWSQALRAAFAIDIEKCTVCGGRRDVIAAIPPGPIVRKILTHLHLPTTVVTRRPCDVWQVRGPPGELVPGDFDDTDVADAVDPPVDEDLDPPFWDDPLNDAGI